MMSKRRDQAYDGSCVTVASMKCNAMHPLVATCMETCFQTLVRLWDGWLLLVLPVVDSNLSGLLYIQTCLSYNVHISILRIVTHNKAIKSTLVVEYCLHETSQTLPPRYCDFPLLCILHID